MMDPAQSDPSPVTPDQQEPGPAPADAPFAASKPDAATPVEGMIEDAKDQGKLAQAPKHRTVSEDDRAYIARLWKETYGGQDYRWAVQQWRRDRETLFGDPMKDLDGPDETKVDFPRILRNRDMSVALCIPEDHSVEWEPEEMVPDPNGIPGQLGADPTTIQFAKTLSMMVRRFAKDAHFQEVAEAWVRDAASYRWAVLKCTWHSDFHQSAITSRRPDDDQDNLARLRVLLEQYQRGEFDKNAALHAEMTRLAQGCFGKSEITLNAGYALDLLPFDRFKVSQEVRTFEQFYHAQWMAEDTVMRRSDVLGHWPYQQQPDGTETGICPDDLRGASVYDDQGVEIQMAEQERQRTTTMAEGDQPIRQINDDDLLLVREIWSKRDNRVYVLVRGLDYAAAEYVPENQPDQFYPYFCIVTTPHSERVYGLSDTEIQAPLGREVNNIRNDEAQARRAAYNRGVFDAGVIDEKTSVDMSDCPANTFIPMKTTGSGDFTKAFVPFPGAGVINEALYDTRRIESDMDKAAMLPSQLTGDMGDNPDFSSEVQLAARGAAVLTKKKLTTVRRAMERVYTAMAEYLLFNVGEAFVKQRLGQHAVWPSTHPERMQVYQNLQVQVKVALDASLERSMRINEGMRLLEALKELQVPLDPNGAARFLSHLFGEDSEVDQLVHGNPLGYVQALVQGGPQVILQLPPPAQQALAELGQLAQQAFMQNQAQAAAAAAAQHGGAPGGQPAPGQQPPHPGPPQPAAPPPPAPMPGAN